MNGFQVSVNPVTIENHQFEFSICTMVTRQKEYGEMLSSFKEKGFDDTNSEFIYVDNSKENSLDAYTSTNLFLRQARGKYIIICHQDILLHSDGISELRSIVEDLIHIDPKWAICGNAGAVAPNHIVYHITYPDGTFMKKGNFPIKVQSLDENFLVVRNSANLRVSSDMVGFHLYATDLVLQAELNGFTSYVIPFNLIHKSRGNKNAEFFKLKKQLSRKYNHYFRSRWIQTNSTVFHLSGNLTGRLLGNKFFLFFVRMINGLKKRM